MVAIGDADADARAGENLLAVDVEALVESAQDALGDISSLLRVDDPVEQDGELVAAEARHRIGGAHRRAEPGGNLLEHEVSRRVPEAVVDRLEVVEVDEDDGDRETAALHAGERVLNAVGEERAIRKTRDRVVERLMRQLVLERLLLADVAAVEDDAADVLLLKKVGLLYLELQPRAVPVSQ